MVSYFKKYSICDILLNIKTMDNKESIPRKSSFEIEI